MSEFQDGDLVDITVKGARIVNAYPTARRELDGTHIDMGTILVFRHPDESDRNRSHTVNMGADGVTVERVAPAEWPPRPGDLWRDSRDGGLWFGMEPPAGGVILNGYDGGRHGPEYVNRERGPLTLVHREGGGTDV